MFIVSCCWSTSSTTPMPCAFNWSYMASRLEKSFLKSLFTPKPPLEDSGLTITASRVSIKTLKSSLLALEKSSHWRPMYLAKVV